ncbi:J domain-containing protein [Rhizobium sp. HT1-10]|uniref:J domain-containing protein n=1 Tax=Rhizobium sp. HT1-10 TaxID=3111638 RepID=UPI003C1E732E
MGLDSKIFDSIRTKRKKPASQADDSGPKCHWDGCDKKGTNRAPVGREAEGEFFLFCLEHVKEYNKGYNFMSGLSDAEIARYQREAATGGRPTWSMGVNKGAQDAPAQSEVKSGAAQAYKFRRPPPRRSPAADRFEPQVRGRKLKTLEAKAFETLGLAQTATAAEIKAKYKDQLKLHHPDANEGDRGSEAYLQAAIEAYKILKMNGFC